jgi:hypothetical protein
MAWMTAAWTAQGGQVAHSLKRYRPPFLLFETTTHTNTMTSHETHVCADPLRCLHTNDYRRRTMTWMNHSGQCWGVT